LSLPAEADARPLADPARGRAAEPAPTQLRDTCHAIHIFHTFPGESRLLAWQAESESRSDCANEPVVAGPGHVRLCRGTGRVRKPGRRGETAGVLGRGRAVSRRRWLR